MPGTGIGVIDSVSDSVAGRRTLGDVITINSYHPLGQYRPTSAYGIYIYKRTTSTTRALLIAGQTEEASIRITAVSDL